MDTAGEQDLRTRPDEQQPSGRVVAVHRDAQHAFSKHPEPSIVLVEGLGVEGDAHAGTTVRHRSRVARDPTAPNLRQVHLIASELFDDLALAGHLVRPGHLGENVTTSGLDLRALPLGTLLDIGEAQVRLTGLRNPCYQIDRFQDGLREAVTTRDSTGKPSLRSGVMSVVTRSGSVRAGDPIVVVLPPPPHVALARV
jgi:MOSC domain-containing protein YiiM